jgi:hypothetical protein
MNVLFLPLFFFPRPYEWASSNAGEEWEWDAINDLEHARYWVLMPEQLSTRFLWLRTERVNPCASVAVAKSPL